MSNQAKLDLAIKLDLPLDVQLHAARELIEETKCLVQALTDQVERMTLQRNAEVLELVRVCK